MNAAVAVFKWVNKYKAIGDSRSFNDGWNTSTLHGAVGFEQPFHQFRNLLRLRTYVVHPLLPPGKGFSNVVLEGPIVCLGKAGINSQVMQLDKVLFGTKVFLVSQLQ